MFEFWKFMVYQVTLRKLKNFLPFWSNCSNWLKLLLGQGGLRLEVPVTAFLAANILIFTAPLKALAETCEADYSFFNMPLLLFVALIGATVGGIFVIFGILYFWSIIQLWVLCKWHTNRNQQLTFYCSNHLWFAWRNCYT